MVVPCYELFIYDKGKNGMYLRKLLAGAAATVLLLVPSTAASAGLLSIGNVTLAPNVNANPGVEVSSNDVEDNDVNVESNDCNVNLNIGGTSTCNN